MQEPEIARNRLSYLWLLPVIALGIGLWLAWSRLSQIGPIIQIAFTSAEGLEAGKTKIRYKDLARRHRHPALTSPTTSNKSSSPRKCCAPPNPF